MGKNETIYGRLKYLLFALAVALAVALVLSAFAMPAVVATAQTTDIQQTPAANQLFLPSVLTDGTASTPVATTPSGTATPLPTPTATRIPVASLIGTVFDRIPDPDQDGVDSPVFGVCPESSHLVHIESGMPGVQNEETEEYLDRDYQCLPDDDPSKLSCGDHGTAVLLGGQAVCSCEDSYVGAACNVCAFGYMLDPNSNTCRIAPLKREPTIAGGIESSMEVGMTKTFTAQDGGGNRLEGRWTLVEEEKQLAGQGAIAGNTACLRTPGTQQCQTTVSGSQVVFDAPASLADGENLDMVQMVFTPIDQNYAATPYSVVIVNENWIPINGFGNSAEMEPILESLTVFMKQRCVGSAMLGVARYGFPLAVYGLGRMDGRAADDWLEACSDNMNIPLAEPVTSETPLRVGSVSKTVNTAIVRTAVEESLKVYDSDVVVTRISDTRFVAAHRNLNGKVELSVYDLDRSENPVKQGDFTFNQEMRNFDLITVGDDRIVLGLRRDDDSIFLGSFQISGDGELALLSQTQLLALGPPPQIEFVGLAMTALLDNPGSTSRFVVATRDRRGRVDLFVTKLEDDGLISVQTVPSFPDAKTRDIDIVDLSIAEAANSRIVVGKQNSSGNQVLTVYDITATGATEEKSSANFFGKIQGFSMTAASSTRVVSAARMLTNVAVGSLRLVSWEVTSQGQINPTHNITGDTARKPRIVATGSDRVVVAVQRGGDDELRLVEYFVSDAGVLAEVATNDEAGIVTALDIAPLTGQRVVVAARNSTNNLQNVVWSDNSDGILVRKGDVKGGKIPDAEWPEDYVAAMLLLGYDLPDLLLPGDLHAIFARDEPFPAFIQGDNMSDGTDCDDLSTLADEQWQDVTLAHIWRHRSGLQGSAPGLSVVLPIITDLRGKTLTAQENDLKSEFGEVTVENGKQALGYPAGTFVRVVPRIEMYDVLTSVAGRCLAWPFGTYEYSNTGPLFLMAVTEHLTGRLFAARDGYPDTHEGSALDIFFERKLGVNTTGGSGIFNHQGFFGLQGYTDPIPTPRIVLEPQVGYYPLWWDRKFPHCVEQDGSCSFDDWLSQVDNDTVPSVPPGLGQGTLRWSSWTRLPVPQYQSERAAARAGEGGLAVSPGTFLTFMRKYWARKGMDQGALRTAWNQYGAKNGALGGAFAEAAHMATSGPQIFTIPRHPELGYLADHPDTDDSFAVTQIGYFTADSESGAITSFTPEGNQHQVYAIGYSSADAFSFGENPIHKHATSLYVARAGEGKVDIYHPTSMSSFSYDVDYEAGDLFAVADFDPTDAYDEMIIAKTSSGSSGDLLVYSINALGLIGPPIKTLPLGLATGDKIAIGDRLADGQMEIFVARASSGLIQIYNIVGTQVGSDQDLSYQAQDGFAVGDVFGSSKEPEILIGRVAATKLDFYNRSDGSYELLYSVGGTFPGYGPGGMVAIADPGPNSVKNHVLLRFDLLEGVLVLEPDPDPETQTNVLVVTLALPDVGPDGKIAGGYFSGQQGYKCARGPMRSSNTLPDGVDFIVALGQSNDQRCEDVGDCDGYKLLRATVMHGICEIDWTDIIPTPPQ